MQVLGLLSFGFVGGLIAVERQQIQTLVPLTPIRHAHPDRPARRQAEKCQKDEIKNSHGKNLSAICTGVNHFLTNASDNDKTKQAVRFLRNLRVPNAEARVTRCPPPNPMLGNFQIKQRTPSRRSAVHNPATRFSCSHYRPKPRSDINMTQIHIKKTANTAETKSPSATFAKQGMTETAVKTAVAA